MEIRQYLTAPSVDLQKISRKSTQTQIHIHTHTHTYKRVALSPYFVILKLEALVYPNAYGKESNTRQQKPACVACTFQLLALLLPPLLLALLAVVAGVWKINCTSTALPLLLAMRICHLHNVCVCVCRCARSMYACVYVCAEEKKSN